MNWVEKMFEINQRKIGFGQGVYIIAEMSANHNQEIDQAVELIRAAKAAGADAIKVQTYTPDTLTIRSDNEYFRKTSGLWQGYTLYDLYSEAYMPWDWQPKLQTVANELGLDFFSSPFDDSAVDFLEELDMPAYKIASFELVDIPLIQRVARTGKPIIMSTGMGTLAEIDEAVQTIRAEGNNQLALLKCTSAYPAPPEEMNLRTIPHLAEAFGIPVGLSDHTLGTAVPIAAVALGACIIEKHFTISREVPGPDSAFSLEPHEFKEMVDAVRVAEKALGAVSYAVTEKEATSRTSRRSLFVVKDMNAGEVFTEENVRSIRPGYGLHTRYFDKVLAKKASQDIKKGTPLSWNLIGA
jgi:pseudaminic acid synthase